MGIRFQGIYDPFRTQTEDDWYPANDLARNLLLLRLRWEDITALAAIRSRTQDTDERKLLTKYLALEIFALHDIVKRVQSLVFQPDADMAHPEVLPRLRKTMRAYNREFREFSGLFTKVRNQLVAHSKDLQPTEIKELWDRLEPGALEPILRVMPTVFECLRDVGLDVWSKSGTRGTIRLAFPLGFSSAVEGGESTLPNSS